MRRPYSYNSGFQPLLVAPVPSEVQVRSFPLGLALIRYKHMHVLFSYNTVRILEVHLPQNMAKFPFAPPPRIVTTEL